VARGEDGGKKGQDGKHGELITEWEGGNQCL